MNFKSIFFPCFGRKRYKSNGSHGNQKPNSEAGRKRQENTECEVSSKLNDTAFKNADEACQVDEHPIAEAVSTSRQSSATRVTNADSKDIVLSAQYLELIVSDVQTWQAQINALLSFISPQGTTDFEDSRYALRARVSSLRKQNQELIGKLNEQIQEKEDLEKTTEALRLELSLSHSDILSKDRKIKELVKMHQEEICTLKDQISHLQRKDQSIRLMANQNASELVNNEWVGSLHQDGLCSKDAPRCSPNTPDLAQQPNNIQTSSSDESSIKGHEESAVSCPSPDSSHLQMEIQRVQECIRYLELQINSKLSGDSPLTSPTKRTQDSLPKTKSCSYRFNSKKNIQVKGFSKPQSILQKSHSSCPTAKELMYISRQMPSLLPKSPTLHERPLTSNQSRPNWLPESKIPSQGQKKLPKNSKEIRRLRKKVEESMTEVDLATPFASVNPLQLQPNWRP